MSQVFQQALWIADRSKGVEDQEVRLTQVDDRGRLEENVGP